MGTIGYRKPILRFSVLCGFAILSLQSLPNLLLADDARRKSVQVLLRDLESPDHEVYKEAFAALEKTNPTDKDAIGHLTLAINSDSFAVYTCAFHVLGILGPAAKDAVPALIRF